MSHGTEMRRLQALLVSAAALALAACASAPTTPWHPTSGQSQAELQAHGASFTPQFEFEAGGHVLSLARVEGAHSPQEEGYLFVDGKFACAAPLVDFSYVLPEYMARGGGGIKRPFRSFYWQLAGVPGGLEFIAGELLYKCDLANERPAPQVLAGPQDPPPPTAQQWQMQLELDRQKPGPYGSIEIGVGELSAQTMAYAGLVALSPYIVAAGTAALIVGSPWMLADHVERKKQLGVRADFRLGISQAEALELLGAPRVEFVLPQTDTLVLAYVDGAAGDFYVGCRQDRVIWARAKDPWLRQQVEQTRSNQQSQPK